MREVNMDRDPVKNYTFHDIPAEEQLQVTADEIAAKAISRIIKSIEASTAPTTARWTEEHHRKQLRGTPLLDRGSAFVLVHRGEGASGSGCKGGRCLNMDEESQEADSHTFTGTSKAVSDVATTK
jgi:hypothetical protein